MTFINKYRTWPPGLLTPSISNWSTSFSQEYAMPCLALLAIPPKVDCSPHVKAIHKISAPVSSMIYRVNMEHYVIHRINTSPYKYVSLSSVPLYFLNFWLNYEIHTLHYTNIAAAVPAQLGGVINLIFTLVNLHLYYLPLDILFKMLQHSHQIEIYG